MKKQRITILVHTLFWLAMLCTPIALNFQGNARGEYALYYLVFGVINISVFYLNLLYIVPRYMKRRKFWILVICWLLLIPFYGTIRYMVAQVMVPFTPSFKGSLTYGREIFQSVFTTGFFVGLSTAYVFVADWFKNEKVKEQLVNAQLKAELSFLKTQINPHFLFNTLNNIYTLAYQKSDKTPDAIMHLSELMRYMLHDSNEERVVLHQELHFIEQLIHLQSLRVNGDMQLQFRQSGDLYKHRIAPLLLISFVENAFKHGVVNDPANPMVIDLQVQDHQLHFSTTNKIHHGYKDAVGGIGLANVQRRLDLLYPNKHTLTITQDDNYYHTQLQINLS
ncbi:histidine kinase [Chitinophaga skermanii]|uniref:Histidine kinase n=1 Tax=Chitinophaga skermanii TaxID=331697 RepID=A0A327QVZ1_9BACT|nr:sensor histidine kinase [Chitinophaga skermanii]RAJ08521.1 histidine kinase [Chitinophaga skermanii]